MSEITDRATALVKLAHEFHEPIIICTRGEQSSIVSTSAQPEEFAKMIVNAVIHYCNGFGPEAGADLAQIIGKTICNITDDFLKEVT